MLKHLQQALPSVDVNGPSDRSQHHVVDAQVSSERVRPQQVVVLNRDAKSERLKVTSLARSHLDTTVSGGRLVAL